MTAWQRRELGDPALRPTRAEGLHVTLCFLGYHPEKAVPRIAELIRRETEGIGPVVLRFDDEATAKPGGRPRLFALGAESEDAVRLQASLEKALAGERFYEPEKRVFWPHVTAARVRSERLSPGKGERRGRGRPKRVREWPGGLPTRLLQPFGAVRVALYRSNLKPQGAEYELLAGVDLPSPGGTEEVNEEDG